MKSYSRPYGDRDDGYNGGYRYRAYSQPERYRYDCERTGYDRDDGYRERW